MRIVWGEGRDFYVKKVYFRPNENQNPENAKLNALPKPEKISCSRNIAHDRGWFISMLVRAAFLSKVKL